MQTTSFTQDVDPQRDSARQAIRPTFGIACWVLAILAFVQLMTVGAALAVRGGQSVEDDRGSMAVATPVVGAIHARSVEQILADLGHSPVVSSVVGEPVLESVAQATRITPPAAVAVPRVAAASASLPSIADPRVERLVQEARRLHLEGDMMHAMLKLDEAARIDPTECACIYQKGILFEGMGNSTRAADQYQQIQQMGIVKAGEYFKLAASKLTKGMDTAAVRRSMLAIGPMKVNRGRGVDAGRHVEVAVTLLARPDQVIQSDDVEVQVHFYDKVNGSEIKKAASNASVVPSWSDAKVDWLDVGNEETLRVSYRIPQADIAEEHLLGRREFYGYVVELLYKGEVVDQQAYPRRLHSIHAGKMAPVYQDDFGAPWLPGDDDGLLPDKNSSAEEGSMPLPTR